MRSKSKAPKAVGSDDFLAIFGVLLLTFDPLVAFALAMVALVVLSIVKSF